MELFRSISAFYNSSCSRLLRMWLLVNRFFLWPSEHSWHSLSLHCTVHSAGDRHCYRSVLFTYCAALLQVRSPDVLFSNHFSQDIQHLGPGGCGPCRTLSQAMNLLPPCALGPAPAPALVQGEGSNLWVGPIRIWLWGRDSVWEKQDKTL